MYAGSACEGSLVTVEEVLAQALWVVGLAGLLATFSFAGWQRRDGGRRHRPAPRLFIPTSFSLVAVCTGALLNGVIHPNTMTGWERVAWSLLLFILILLLAADRISSRGQAGWGKTRLGFTDGGEDF